MFKMEDYFLIKLQQ